MSLFCAAALFAACSSTDDLEPVVQTGLQTESDAVNFDVYARGTQPTTRAGYVGEIDATTFQATGFGVYGYVTSAVWAGSAEKPNFMANQYVSYNSTTAGWTYSPIKYWPNQANTTASNAVDGLGGGTATTTQPIDYVSFFAYAPYVESTSVPFFGKVTSPTEQSSIQRAKAEALTDPSAATTTIKDGFNYDGIISLPGDNEGGNPKIAYVVPENPAYGVDLMYGVAARAYTTKETTGQMGSAVAAGTPFKDLTKQVVDDKISYRFQHALTKLGINVDAYFDEVRDISHNNDVDANTRIVIESISIQGTDGSTPQKLYSFGVLNLNNTAANTPTWEDCNAEVTDLSSRIANGLSLVPITTVASGLTVTTATKEQGAKYFSLQPLGVTKTKKSLFGNDISGKGNATLMLIPGANNATASAVSVTIKYHVITRDANLENGVSDITNEITNSLGNIALKAGSQTIINLHLGMTTVKLDAQVADWDGSNAKEVDLPANVQIASLTASSFGVAANGLITASGIKAAITGTGGTVDLGIGDVYFTDKDNNVLPVKQESTNYYLPSNYTTAPREVYMWYGGQKYATKADQPALAASAFSVEVTDPTANINAAGYDVKLTVSADVQDFNCDDWTVTASYGSPATALDVPLQSANSEDKTFTVKVPKNETGSTRDISFTVTHKNTTLTATTSAAKTQDVE